jgi:serine/threonine protein kinase
MLRFAVKVYRSSKPGVSSSKLKDFAAQELRALQLLRGCNEAVQLMAEGELVCRDSAGSSAAAGSFSPASSSKAASARADAGAASHSTVAAAAKSNSSAPYFSSCIVTELAQQTLRGVMQRVGVINEPYAQSVAIQLLKLLVVAHSGDLGFVIVHRDLNPQNILYFDSGRIAAADFGISHVSKVVETAAGAAAAPVYMDTAIGTAYYAAPDLCGRIERPAQPLGSSAAAGVIVKLEDGGGINISSSSSNGSRRGYDASVDVFAVGVIVLEMLVGKLGGLFKHGALTLSQLLLWEQQVRRIVDGEVQLPAGVVVSPAALQFIGCCCGVGREREEAAARGEAKRLTPAVLLLHSPWLQ